MSAPHIRFRIDFAEHSNVGPGKIALLEAIQTRGSLTAAARALGMSYRRAWMLLASLNDSFNLPVSVATTGGRNGGGVELTEFGLNLIGTYRALEADIERAAEARLSLVMQSVVERAASKSPRRSISPSL